MRQRKIWISALLIILSALMIFSCSCEKDNRKLSEMTTEEQIKFVKKQGIEIPEGYEDTVERRINEIIFKAEEYPWAPIPPTTINDPKMTEFAKEVGDAVHKYYEQDTD